MDITLSQVIVIAAGILTLIIPKPEPEPEPAEEPTE